MYLALFATAFAVAMDAMGVVFDAIPAEGAELAGRLWADHRRRTKELRSRVVADFIVGAHAQSRAQALLTRDRGFYRRCFADLRVIDPSA